VESETSSDLATVDVEFARLLVLELYDGQLRAPAATAPLTPTEPAEPIEPIEPTASAEPATEADNGDLFQEAATEIGDGDLFQEAATEIGDGDLFQEAALEFTLPPGELDRIFIESRPRLLQSVPTVVATEATHPPQSAVESVEGPPNRTGGLDVSESVRREVLAGFEEMALPEFADRRHRGLPFAIWLCAAIFLALCVAAQLIHENREWIATHAPFGSRLGSLYAVLGVARPASSNLSAYQLRQWGVTGDPGANGSLRMRASILNTAAQMQPYPLLRVTLANRFGSPLGARDFEPAEYLGKPVARMLAPAERVDAILDILDPGNDAEGFEIDVCLRGTDQRIRCAADAAAQAKP
jgi:hypothetical protein